MSVEACGVGPFKYIFFHNIACYLFIGSASEVHNCVEGYEPGIATVISKGANITAYRGKTKYLPDEDCFSAILKCHDIRDLATAKCACVKSRNLAGLFVWRIDNDMRPGDMPPTYQVTGRISDCLTG